MSALVDIVECPVLELLSFLLPYKKILTIILDERSSNHTSFLNRI
jgi:hypothetical protein